MIEIIGVNRQFRPTVVFGLSIADLEALRNGFILTTEVSGGDPEMSVVLVCGDTEQAILGTLTTAKVAPLTPPLFAGG